MVRAATIRHPSEWSSSGYNDIQEPRRKCALIDYEKLRELVAIETYKLLKAAHKAWVDESLRNVNNIRESKWTLSIALGSERFVERTKAELGIRAKERKVQEAGGAYELRERQVSYPDDFGPKNNIVTYISHFPCNLLILLIALF